MTETTFGEFKAQCLKYYGEDGIYPLQQAHKMSAGVELNDLTKAIGIRLERQACNGGGSFDFQGDYFDRQLVRDILCDVFGYTSPE